MSHPGASLSSAHSPKYLEELSAAQREAVVYDEGPALVIAGAGSGKTRVLVAKLLHLMDRGYAPDRLMALTFTNKAAREMKDRIAKYAGYDTARRLRMGTFHSIFRTILSIHADLLGFRSDFAIYDSGDSQTLIKRCVRELDLDDKVYNPRTIHSRISLAKNRLLSPSDYASSHDLLRYDQQTRLARLTDVYARYQVSLKRNMAMDFDDLLYYTNVLFRDYPDIRTYWQNRIDYLLIDEYQDTNFAQYLIALQLMGPDGRIFAVGDDSQSIYSFRGANIENIIHFRNSYPSMRLFKLEENYRSTRTIVDVAGRLIAHNKNQIPKEIFSSKEKGDPVIVKSCISGDTEATWVTSVIDEMHYRDHVDFDSFAILYRTNSQSRILEQELRKRGIPFRIYGGLSFFARREIKDVLAYFRLIINPQDDEALLRCVNYPKRGIGDTSLAKLRAVASQAQTSIYDTIIRVDLLESVSVNASTRRKLGDFAAMIQSLQQVQSTDLASYGEMILKRSGLHELFFNDRSIEGISRQENIRELLNGIAQYQFIRQEEGQEETSLSNYLADVSLLTDQDVNDGSKNEPHVTLMTVHSAKGLEFAHVFIIGLEEQLFPSSLSRTESEIEEERRLFYVAITRSKQSCRISFASERFLNGHYERRGPSRFLREIEGKGVEMDAAFGFRINNQKPFSHGLDAATDYDHAPRMQSAHSSYGYGAQPRTMGGGRRLKRLTAHSESSSDATDFGHLRVGMQVEHLRFGIGTITSIEGEGADTRADVLFESSVGQKKLLLRFAKLRAIE